MPARRSELTGGLFAVEHIMGMPIEIDIRDADVDLDVPGRAFDWLRFVDATFSTYRAESEISRLNRGELAVGECHPDVREVLNRCEQLRFETNGYFDIRLPPGSNTVDPSGLVKGWSIDRAGEILRNAGAVHFSVNAGGDVLVKGGVAAGSPWRIGIQHPFLRDQVAAVVAAYDLGIATSGEYERGAHILDPHTGNAPAGVLSVTVTGPGLATADAYATAAFAMGEDGPAWTAGLAGYEAMTILADQTVVLTPGFPKE